MDQAVQHEAGEEPMSSFASRGMAPVQA